jgi:hypothetical protein
MLDFMVPNVKAAETGENAHGKALYMFQMHGGLPTGNL